MRNPNSMPAFSHTSRLGSVFNENQAMLSPSNALKMTAVTVFISPARVSNDGIQLIPRNKVCRKPVLKPPSTPTLAQHISPNTLIYTASGGFQRKLQILSDRLYFVFAFMGSTTQNVIIK
ncbi:hypothetical protein [Pseudomonas savastanoi]|uniref:hypothetical protein n=1 Tax=Pseudomonas savastanoi TaxID=29438 RepID=UPI0018ACABDC|nr:hypothetical protein [Pseudomonas savastanoi]